MNADKLLILLVYFAVCSAFAVFIAWRLDRPIIDWIIRRRLERAIRKARRA